MILARSVGLDPGAGPLAARLARLHEFLAHELMPHAVAEGRVTSPRSYRTNRVRRRSLAG